MRRIPLKREFLSLVAQGRKHSTIRPGRRADAIGPALLVCANDAMPVTVSKVDVKRLSELDEEDAHRDGFDSLAALIETLKGFYPDLGGDDVVSVLHFERASAPR